MNSKAFWQEIDRQITGLTMASTAADIMRILATPGNPYGDPHISAAPAFFAGGGGRKSVRSALTAAGWHLAWSKAPYYYTMTAPDGSMITYCEGDVYPGSR